MLLVIDTVELNKLTNGLYNIYFSNDQIKRRKIWGSIHERS